MSRRRDAQIARTWIRVAAIQAAQIAADLTGDAGDTGALADQFEAAGLEDLARHGLDVRTRPQTDERPAEASRSNSKDAGRPTRRRKRPRGHPE